MFFFSLYFHLFLKSYENVMDERITTFPIYKEIHTYTYIVRHEMIEEKKQHFMLA